MLHFKATLAQHLEDGWYFRSHQGHLIMHISIIIYEEGRRDPRRWILILGGCRFSHGKLLKTLETLVIKFSERVERTGKNHTPCPPTGICQEGADLAANQLLSDHLRSPKCTQGGPKTKMGEVIWSPPTLES